jgi:hypothetical protein
MATSSQTLHRFISAMKAVYGDFTTLPSSTAAASFTFPTNPGAGGHRGRYLWTDAFGVINFLTLARETSSPVYLALAKRLAQTVHDVLGRTRDGSARLPRATNAEPLKGGLRIGKVDAAGPDGDGQYHHYLTLWMFALNRLAIASREREYNDLAVQLARAIHPHFMVRDQGGRPQRMVWKVSMDLNEVLVHSEGALDAVTGYVIFRLLQKTAAAAAAVAASATEAGKDGSGQEVLSEEVEDYRYLMQHGGRLRPRGGRDPLDLGMGLWTCHLARDEPWAQAMVDAGLESARVVMDEKRGVVARDPSRRLAFRELGACLGLQCVDSGDELKRRAKEVTEFWCGYLDQETEEDLRPISKVMLAAALIPGGKRPLLS